MQIKLSKSEVDRLKPQAKRYEVWDTETNGLHVRVEPTGRKAYMVYVRDRDGRQVRKALGECGQLGLDKAREAAQRVFYEARYGDPQKVKKSPAGITLGALCQRYIDEHLKPDADRTGRRASLINAQTVLLGKRLAAYRDTPVNKITIDDMEALYKEISKTTVAGANHLFDSLRAAWNWGAPALCPRDNPMAFKRRPNGKRTRYLFPSELQAFYGALQASRRDPRTGWLDQIRLCAVELMIFTGVRVGAACDLPKAKVRYQDRVVIFKEKGGVDLVKPLTHHVAGLLRTVPNGESAFVFPGRKVPHTDQQGVWKIVRDLAVAAGITGISPHTLRHTYATYAKSAPRQGLSLDEVKTAVGHANAQMTERYAHALAPVDAANAQYIEDYLLGIVQAGDSGVVQLLRA